MADNPHEEEGLFEEEIDHLTPELPKKSNLTQEQVADHDRVRITDIHPIQQKNIKSNALQYDIKLGWMPRGQISGPIPLAYAHPDMDDLINSNIRSIIYLGYRPTNSFDIHRNFYDQGRKYPFNQFHLCKSQFLERFFKKYYSDFQFQSSRQLGMILDDSELVFDSYFEGGNLDAVYYHQFQYRLFLRVDTNTKGHCNYFYFKVRNKSPGKYAFRIVNMSKANSLYERGMRPYIRTKNDPVWRQGGDKVKYGPSPLYEEYQLAAKIYSLKFEYTFRYANEQVEFCYGIPFVYSQLLTFLNSFRSHPSFYMNKLCYSLSGLEIPLITITDNEKQKQQENKNKAVVIISGRVHPGETHGSHLINGFIKKLLSDTAQAVTIRKNLIVKIIPMINPDGVVIGNTRTSFTGKDLNRVYSNKTDFVFPQIIGVRDFTRKIKEKYGNKLLFFIDVHGHSTRKNSFFFGPEFPVFDQEYAKCRMLARIYASKTEIFRYYSCKFRISNFKEKTCRGFFNNKNIVRTYTHETSMHCFFDFEKRKDRVFDVGNLEALGENLLASIHDYIVVVLKLKEMQIPEPVNKKKTIKRKASEQFQEEEEDSDQMASDRADSEDSDDDFGSHQMKMFFNRINENRQYFYEQICAMNGLKRPQLPQKKQKVIYSNSSDAEPSSPIKLTQTVINPTFDLKKPEFELKKKKLIDPIPKLSLTQKKKTFQQYDKISNVVFGGNVVSLMPENKQYLYSKTKSIFPNQTKYATKYSFINVASEVNFQSENAKFSQTKLPKPKITQVREKNRYQLIPFPSKSSDKPKLLDHESLNQLITKPKSLNILSTTNQRFLSKSEPKLVKPMQETLSMKFLSGKKNIKNIREEEQYRQKKIVKSIRPDVLTKKLPSLNKLFNQS